MEIAIKRRGILAAAGVVVAGIVAQRAAQPVAATAGTGPDGNLVLGSNDINNTTNYTNLRTQVVSGLGNPTGTGFHGAVLFDCSASPFQSSGDANVIGVSGTSRGTAAGVYGTDNVGSKPSGYPAGMNAGVYGYTGAQGHSGVRGDGGTYGIGVSGVSFNSNAILGTTLSSTFNGNAAVLGLGYGTAVEGDVPAGANIANSVGVKGTNQSTVAGGSGVLGQIMGSATNTFAVQGVNQSTGANGVGVFGQSAGDYGVLGYSTGGSASLAGISTSTNIPAFAGGNSAAGGLAASFAGTVFVSGKLIVSDPSYKSGMLKHPDGFYRLVYCMESPESWIEDFGNGQVTNGKGAVKLDPDFAAVTQTGDYHVFITPYGNTNGLHVVGRTASGFSVMENNGGTSTVGFSYRVVAKPKTEKKLSRLEKFNPPDVKLPDPSTFPKPSADAPKLPDAPQVQPPARPAPPPAAPPQGSSTTQGGASSIPVQPAPPPRP